MLTLADLEVLKNKLRATKMVKCIILLMYYCLY